jgi:membrane protease YdiL (CAAX protease family)
VWGQLLHPAPNLAAALGCMAPLLAICAYGVAAADRDAGFGQLRDVFQQSLIPSLQRLPGWGLCLLALGAGLGEETLFRAFLQTATIGGIQGAAPGLDPAAAAAAGVAASSLAFGALHALTPVYFLFATTASALFGELRGCPTDPAGTHEQR